MNRPEETKRVYTLNDADALSLEKTIRSCFLQDQADFAAFDTRFGAPYETDFQNDITAAEEEAADNYILTQQEELTAEVEKWMEASKKSFQSAKYFIDQAFPSKTLELKEFGYNDYEKARKSQTRMIQFMKQFHKTAVKYSDKLLAKGYTQAKINEIISLKTALDEANQKQEAFKKDRTVFTQERVEKLNAAWKRMQDVCNAAKNIYSENYAKYSRYITSERTGTQPSPPPPLPPEPPVQ